MRPELTERSDRKFVRSNLILDIFPKFMNYYFYILECKDKKKYYGHTNDLIERLNAHNRGRVKFTKNKRPIKLVYFEICSSRSEAFSREQQFKNGKTRKKTVEKLISEFGREKCQGFNSQTACRPTTYVRFTP